MLDPLITVITPTTGSRSLNRLMESMDKQSVRWVHILLWDDKREDHYLWLDEQNNVKDPHVCQASYHYENKRYSIVVPGTFVQGPAAGSALRAIGLMAANTPYVTFADSDVWYDENHFERLVEAIKGKE